MGPPEKDLFLSLPSRHQDRLGRHGQFIVRLFFDQIWQNLQTKRSLVTKKAMTSKNCNCIAVVVPISFVTILSSVSGQTSQRMLGLEITSFRQASTALVSGERSEQIFESLSKLKEGKAVSFGGSSLLSRPGLGCVEICVPCAHLWVTQIEHRTTQGYERLCCCCRHCHKSCLVELCLHY